MCAHDGVQRILSPALKVQNRGVSTRGPSPPQAGSRCWCYRKIQASSVRVLKTKHLLFLTTECETDS